MDLIILHLVLLFDTLYTLTIIHSITYFFYILRCIKSYPKNLLLKITFTVAVLILKKLKEGRRKYKYEINKPLCFFFSIHIMQFNSKFLLNFKINVKINVRRLCIKSRYVYIKISEVHNKNV